MATKKPESDTAFTIRAMTEKDLPKVMELRREMKVHDVQTVLETWLKIDPDGMKVIVTDSGDVVGCGVVVQNNHDVYVGGMYCVSTKYRNCAAGRKLFQIVYARAEEKNIVGNAVMSMAGKYKQAGSFPIAEDRFICIKNWSSHSVNPACLSDKVPEGVLIELYHEHHLQSVVAYDTSVVYFSRERLLELSCLEQDTKTFVALRNEICVGYGTIRRSCLNAGRVGPLYADDPQIAEALLKKLIEAFPDVSGFAMNTISTNIEANEFIKKLGCTVTEKCVRIYKTKLEEANLNKIYAQFDFNFTVF